MRVSKVLDKFNRKLKRYSKNENNYKSKIDNLQKKLDKNKYPHFIDNVLEPIAKEMAQRMNKNYEILGPFGLTCETSIHFYRKQMRDRNKDYNTNKVKSITFRPFTKYVEGDIMKGYEKEYLEIVDYSKDTNKFQDGTLGQINGMNYPTKQMPLTITGLIKEVN